MEGMCNVPHVICALLIFGREIKSGQLGGIPSWPVIWGLLNDAKLLQNLGVCLLLDHFRVVSFFYAIALNAHPK
jgi:hypothetical protein